MTNELVTINGVDWNLEMGALTELIHHARPNPPAILFQSIPGFPKGFRVLSGAANSSQRLAITLGFPVPKTPMDVVRAYRLLATEGRPGVAYNICSGTSVSIGELAGLLLGLTDARMRLVEDPDLLRPVELPELRGDASLLRRHTGWAPSISLDETLFRV